MRKRPLASACLLIVLFFYFAVSLLPFSPRGLSEGGKWKVKVTGKVYQKEVRQQAGQAVRVLYLKNLSGDSPPGKGALCYLKSGQAEPEMGSIVTVEGSYKEFETASNPGQFDSYTYYLISGISYRLNQAMILEKTVGYSKTGEALYRFKAFLSRRLSENLPEKESALMKTILLGEKGELDREVKELYQRNGIAHILAISGLHVSMLGMGLYHVLRKCGAPMKVSALAAAILLLLYGTMTGFSVSALRAILMFFLHMLAVMLERTYDMMTALSVAAVILLIGQPLYLEYSGFIFSFGCVLGIGVLTPALTEGKGAAFHRKKKAPARMLKLFLSALTMGVITLPIYLWYYFQFPFWSMLLNLVIIPLMSYLMAAGILLLFASVVFPFATYPLGHMIQGIFKIFELACGINEKLPVHMVTAGKPAFWQMVLWMAVLLLVIFLKKRLALWTRWSLILLAVLALVWRPGNKLAVTFLDVGQGDGIYVETADGSRFLVDGGSSSVSGVGKYRLLPFLRYQGTKKLDAVFVTHPDADHCNGVKEILEQNVTGDIRVCCLILPDIGKEARNDAYKELEDVAERNQVPVAYISRGQRLQAGGVSITCLHPQKGYGAEDANAYSTVLSLTYGNFSALLTGDLEGEGERELSAYIRKQEGGQIQDTGKYTVLKAAHHGSAYSTPAELLDWCRPYYTVISCGENNSYGHPHKELLGRLADCGTDVMVTYETGAVTFETDGERVWVSRFLQE